MTDDAAGENNIESLAQRAKEVLDRVRSNADDIDLFAVPTEQVPSRDDVAADVDLDVPEVDVDTEVSAAATPGGYISAIQETDDTDPQLDADADVEQLPDDESEESGDDESAIAAAIGLDEGADVDSDIDVEPEQQGTDDETVEAVEAVVEDETPTGVVDDVPEAASAAGATTDSFDADSLRVEPAEEESNRRLGCLIPLLLLGLLILALILFWGSLFGDDEAVLLDGDTVASTTSEPLEATTATTELEATTSSSDTTTTTTTTEVPPTIPDTAWELLGGATGTDQFASFGAPFGLQAILEGADAPGLDGFTLLAPSNEAIAALSQEDIASFGQDPASAEALINYHIIDQRLTPELLLSAAGGQLESRIGLPIDVALDGDDLVLNGQARVALDALIAENAHILVIDSVLQPPTINTVIELGEVQFEVISAIITPAGEVELQKAVEFFQNNPDANAVIEGHTDTDGPAGPNQALSERRANAVRDFLISQGVDGSRLTAEGFGETQPIIVDGVEDKVASRRIELNIR